MIALLLAAVCMCGEAPERANDFFWENDKFGMRAYGPGDVHCWSGFDVFNKTTDAAATCGHVLRNHDKCGNWHATPFDGVLDNYAVGAGRGCGGIALFADGEWKTFPNWKKCRVIANSDERCEFELVYPAFSDAGEMTCRIELRRGERFFRNKVEFERPLKGAWAGPGLDLEPKRGHVGDVWEDAGLGVVALYENDRGEVEGSTATAIFMPGAQRILTDAQNCRVLSVTGVKSFEYWAGAAWSKAGEVASAAAWRREIESFIHSISKEAK